MATPSGSSSPPGRHLKRTPSFSSNPRHATRTGTPPRSPQTSPTISRSPSLRRRGSISSLRGTATQPQTEESSPTLNSIAAAMSAISTSAVDDADSTSSKESFEDDAIEPVTQKSQFLGIPGKSPVFRSVKDAQDEERKRLSTVMEAGESRAGSVDTRRSGEKTTPIQTAEASGRSGTAQLASEGGAADQHGGVGGSDGQEQGRKRQGSVSKKFMEAVKTVTKRISNQGLGELARKASSKSSKGSKGSKGSKNN